MTANAAHPQSLLASDPPLRIAMVGNGATVHALVRGEAIAALGHTVRLVTLGPVLPHSRIEVCTRPIPQTPLQSLRAFRSFQDDLRDFRPDLLHVHYAGGRLGSLALASGIKPLVVTVMGGDVQPEQHMGRANWFDHRATKRLLRESDVLLAKSTALRTDIARYGDYTGKIETVRWGIDQSRFAHKPGNGEALRRKLDLRDRPMVLSPRSLRPLYNIHLIVEAMPAILAQCPETLLLISRHREEPEYAGELRRRVSALGIAGSVRFIEPIDFEEMPALLSIVSVVVSVPFSDGLPQTLFESLASEAPIVLGRLDAYREIVDHEREVLLSDLNAPALAAAVSRLLLDPALASRLRTAGLKRIQQEASLPDEARRVETFYRRVLAEGRRPSPLGPRLLDAISLAFRRG